MVNCPRSRVNLFLQRCHWVLINTYKSVDAQPTIDWRLIESQSRSWSSAAGWDCSDEYHLSNSKLLQTKIPFMYIVPNCFLYLTNLIICSVAIRGDHQDEAVLCTDKATFDLKVAETSNSLLLVPHCSLPKEEGNLSSVSVICLFFLIISCNFF